MAREGQITSPSHGVLTDISRDFGLTFSGEVSFRATLTPAVTQSGVFATSLGTILEIAKTGDLAQGTQNPADTFNLIGGDTLQPEYNGGGRAGFRATTIGNSMLGVWTGVPGSLSWVTDGQATPPGVSGSFFEGIDPVSVNSIGEVAFRACLLTNCNDSGIWWGTGATLAKIAKTFENAPNGTGQSTTDSFANFSNPVINNNGNVAFRATLGGLNEGIWRRHNGPNGLRRVVRTGDALRGTNLTFVRFDTDMVINNDGELAFTATVTNGTNESRGLFVTYFGSIIKIVRETETYELPGPVTKIIYEIDFYPGSIEQGVSSFSEESSVAYRLIFNDANFTDAIVLTTLDT